MRKRWTRFDSDSYAQKVRSVAERFNAVQSLSRRIEQSALSRRSRQSLPPLSQDRRKTSSRPATEVPTTKAYEWMTLQSQQPGQGPGYKQRMKKHIHPCVCDISPARIQQIDQMAESRRLSRAELQRRLERVHEFLRTRPDHTKRRDEAEGVRQRMRAAKLRAEVERKARIEAEAKDAESRLSQRQPTTVRRPRRQREDAIGPKPSDLDEDLEDMSPLAGGSKEPSKRAARSKDSGASSRSGRSTQSPQSRASRESPSSAKSSKLSRQASRQKSKPERQKSKPDRQKSKPDRQKSKPTRQKSTPSPPQQSRRQSKQKQGQQGRRGHQDRSSSRDDRRGGQDRSTRQDRKGRRDRSSGQDRRGRQDGSGGQDRRGRQDRSAGPDRSGRQDRNAGPDRRGRPDRSGPEDRNGREDSGGRQGRRGRQGPRAADTGQPTPRQLRQQQRERRQQQRDARQAGRTPSVDNKIKKIVIRKVRRQPAPQRESYSTLGPNERINWRKEPSYPIHETKTSRLRKLESEYCASQSRSRKVEKRYQSLTPERVRELIRRPPPTQARLTRTWFIRLEAAKKLDVRPKLKYRRPSFEAGYRLMLKYRPWPDPVKWRIRARTSLTLRTKSARGAGLTTPGVTVDVKSASRTAGYSMPRTRATTGRPSHGATSPRPGAATVTTGGAGVTASPTGGATQSATGSTGATRPPGSPTTTGLGTRPTTKSPTASTTGRSFTQGTQSTAPRSPTATTNLTQGPTASTTSRTQGTQSPTTKSATRSPTQRTSFTEATKDTSPTPSTTSRTQSTKSGTRNPSASSTTPGTNPTKGPTQRKS